MLDHSRRRIALAILVRAMREAQRTGAPDTARLEDEVDRALSRLEDEPPSDNDNERSLLL